MAQTGILQYMTTKRREEFDAQLTRGEYPALTVENIYSFMEGLTSQAGPLLVESIREVFDWLRPRYNRGVGALKTNKKFKVGYKVIVGGVVEPDYGGVFRLRYYRDNEIRALGNVLSLLDGKGVLQYPEDLLTKLRVALKATSVGETCTLPYFIGRPCLNQNLHMTFTRHDLIDRMNQLATDGTILGEDVSK